MVRVLLSRRIHRRLEPPLEHRDIRRRVSAAARRLCGRGRPAQISLLLCSDRIIAELNGQWLGRGGPTNVIAFPSADLASHTALTGPLEPVPGTLDTFVEPGLPPAHLGDVAVSVDAALREAGAGGRDGRAAYLALHGLLHVLGWEHEDEASWRRMHAMTLALLGGPGEGGASPRRGGRS